MKRWKNSNILIEYQPRLAPDQSKSTTESICILANSGDLLIKSISTLIHSFLTLGLTHSSTAAHSQIYVHIQHETLSRFPSINFGFGIHDTLITEFLFDPSNERAIVC